MSSGVMTLDGVVIEGSLLEATSGTDTDGGSGGAIEDIAGDGDGATHGDEKGVSQATGEGGTSGGDDDVTL
ncbi:UNVERIFIED_CONTAM: hypothetical protein Slati_4491500 [Sesamum latifolium]|uniref:Uncharacterized protein n=1 Tax=Sesamum latifolium TaxID=2727402 RepID=A0AAW2STQ8_9LAMI